MKNVTSRSTNKNASTAVKCNISKTGTSASKKTNSTYLSNAPKIYTSYGTASSYGRPTQSYGTKAKTSTQVAVKKVSSQTNSNAKKTKSTSSITYGRPKESYVSQKNEKTTSKSSEKELKPQAVQRPISISNTKSKNSSLVKNYLPSNSRDGAGAVFYSKKTSPIGAKEGASLAAGFLPYVGDAKDAQEAITGKDVVTGRKLTKSERVITAAATVVPFVSGKFVNNTIKVVKSKPVKKAMKSGTKNVITSTSGIVSKAKNTFKNTGEKINKTTKNSGKIAMNGGEKQVDTNAAIEINLSKSKYPQSTQHIQEAIKSGHPSTLTINRKGAKTNRKASLKGVDKVPGFDLDEYPPAMFKEGGNGASVRLINPSDNRGAGATIGNLLRPYTDGTKVTIKIKE